MKRKFVTQIHMVLVGGMLSFATGIPSSARADDRAPALGCSILLAQGKQREYLDASTPADRTRLRLEYLRMLEDLGTYEGRSASPYVKSADLGTAWWNVGFFRWGIDVDARELRVHELRELLTAPDRKLYQKAMGTAYRIAEFRNDTVYRLTQLADWVGRKSRLAGSWVGARMSRAVPLDFTIAMEELARKTAPSREFIAAKAKIAGDRIRNWTGKLPDSFSARASVSNSARARSITLYAVLRMREGLFAIANLVSPVSLRYITREKWIEKTAPIFTKLEKNFEYVPTDGEMALLREYRAESAFTIRQAALRKNPKWYKGIHIAKATAQGATLVGLGTAVAAAIVQSEFVDGTVDVETFLTDPKYAPKPGEVQLINETIPFPHMALRIGDSIFSYGVSEMTVTPVSVYLAQHRAAMKTPEPAAWTWETVKDADGRIVKLEKVPAKPESPTTMGIVKDRFAKAGENFANFMARQRSVQVVTLDLGRGGIDQLRANMTDAVGKPYAYQYTEEDFARMGPPEVRALRGHLALQERKTYRNKTLVNDCATMAIRAIERVSDIRVPDLIDASPSSVIMYFASQRIYQKTRNAAADFAYEKALEGASVPRVVGTRATVSSVRLVTTDKNQNPALQLIRNVYVNAREFRLWADPMMLAWNQGERIKLDHEYKPDQLEYYDKANLESFRKEWDDVEAELKEDPELSMYFDNKERLKTSEVLRKGLATTLHQRYEAELVGLEFATVDVDQALKGFYRLQYLSAAEEELLGTKSFDLDQAFSDPAFLGELRQLVESVKSTPPPNSAKGTLE